MRALFIWSLLVALAPLARAQDQERYELSLSSADRATFLLDLELDEASTRRLVEGQPDEASRRAAVELWAAQQLAAWSGPIAWEPVELASAERVELHAVGWFEPGSVLRLEERRDGLPRTLLTWRRAEATHMPLVLHVIERLDGRALPSPSVRETLRLGSAGIAEARKAIGALLAGDMSERTLAIWPGRVTEVTRATWVADPSLSALAGPVDGAVGAPEPLGDAVTLLETPELRAARADRHLEELQRLAADVEAGRRTLDAAVAAVESRVVVLRTEVTAEPLSDSPAAVDSFTRGLEAARASWAASPWREQVEQARAPVPVAGIEPLAPLAPATRPAAAAPSIDTAPILLPGEHALSCDLEAWFRIDLKAGQTAHVEVRPSGDGDLDLELWADGKSRRELVASSAAGTPVEVATWRAAKDGPVWARVWKGTARFTLVVRVE